MDISWSWKPTTSIQFNGVVYRQVHIAPMGSPVSAVVLDMFMENLDKTAMDTAPSAMKPKIWKRYIDDSFEVVSKCPRDALTEHFNSINTIGSIKFTELETDGIIPFLHALIS